MPVNPKRGVIPALLLGLALSACTASPPPPPDASPLADALAAALTTGDLSSIPFVTSADVAIKEYGIVTKGLGGVKPTVEVADITYTQSTDTTTASVRLNQTYDLGRNWQFPSLATLYDDPSKGWQVLWAPTIVQPALDGYTRLTVSHPSATRGQILAADGSPIVYNRPVEKVGIDKSQVTAEQAVASARQLAKLVDVNADTYATQVANGGPRQFVIAITYRQGLVPKGVSNVPGALIQPGTMSLGPSKTFAIGLLGSAGDATAEDIANSGGKFSEGDIVGHTGLQASQDSALRGTDGAVVYLTPRDPADVMAYPVPTDSASPSTPTDKKVLFNAAAIDGADLQTTLNVNLQAKAEKALEQAHGIAAMVVLDVNSGAILAAANSSAAGANPYATTGRYAPGSTFKIVTALALLRTGKTLNTKLNCPKTVTVDGMTFKNVTGYEPAHNGSITLRQAVAWSCNTAMINAAMMVGPTALADAAASLGIGVDHDLGFASFFGSVPSPTEGTAQAGAGIGQGTVVMSPLAMAVEAASVASGHTVVPYLLMDDIGQPWQPADATPAPDVTPLTSHEASQLREIMGAVIDIGTGATLKGLAKGAKTGTAEFTDNGKLKTHAWMICFTDKYAIAAYVHVGQSGAAAAGPLIRSFLS